MLNNDQIEGLFANIEDIATIHDAFLEGVRDIFILFYF